VGQLETVEMETKNGNEKTEIVKSWMHAHVSKVKGLINDYLLQYNDHLCAKTTMVGSKDDQAMGKHHFLQTLPLYINH